MGFITILSPHHQRDNICWFNCSFCIESGRKSKFSRFKTKTLPNFARFNNGTIKSGSATSCRKKKHEFARRVVEAFVPVGVG